MSTLSNPVSISWVPTPWVRARAPSAFAGLANCPDISFFLPNLYRIFQSPFSAGEGDLANRIQSAGLRIVMSEGVKSDTQALPCMNFCLPSFP